MQKLLFAIHCAANTTETRQGTRSSDRDNRFHPNVISNTQIIAKGTGGEDISLVNEMDSNCRKLTLSRINIALDLCA